MTRFLCVFSPVTCAATTVAKATVGDLFNAFTSWVLGSVQWLLDAAGAVLTRSSEPATVVRAASGEYTTLVALAAPLMLVGLLVTTLGALRHGEGAQLWRVYLGVVPACVLAIAAARPFAGLILSAVDQLSSSAAATVAARESVLAARISSLPATTPGFGLLLLGGAVVVGCALLWCELVVRTVVLAVLLVMVPVIVPLSTFPSVRRIGWRLGETFVAVAASKFVIVVVLVLGLDELTGDSATQVVTGAVTLVLAAVTPFVVLRLVPFLEHSALHQVEGLRQRATRAVQAAPSSPVVAAALALAPEPEPPGPPERREDLGLATWEGDGDLDLPPADGERPPAPVGEPRLRGGHVAYHLDEDGPVVGWHFDE
ncbi:MAG: hypothetical protein KGJ36_01895 [Acidobacteriota bacterium]|nr:hypothetical protein [Acidobacteriota bacterium]